MLSAILLLAVDGCMTNYFKHSLYFFDICSIAVPFIHTAKSPGLSTLIGFCENCSYFTPWLLFI